LNHQYQFKNYLNLNIDNHFLKNLSDKSTTTTTTATNITATNHASLTQLPVIQTQSVSNQSQTVSTATLPNLNISNRNPQGLATNDAIGSRLYNFQNTIIHQRVSQSGSFKTDDPNLSTTIPLRSKIIQETRHQPSLLPSSSSFMHAFFNSGFRPRGQDNNPKLDKPIRSSKTYKFVSTMRLKGASVKRAIISNIKSNPTPPQRPPMSDYTLPSPLKDQKIVCDSAVRAVALSLSNSVSISSTNSMSALALVQATTTDNVLKTENLTAVASDSKEAEEDMTIKN
jgi:hypothetical protein